MPAAVAAAIFVPSARTCCRRSIVAVPVAFVCGLIGISAARRARFRVDRSVYRAGRAARSGFARFLVWAGLYVVARGRARARLLRAAPRGVVARRHRAAGVCAIIARVFEIGNSLREARDAPRGRLHPGRAGDEDPRQVPARARGRAVRRSSRRRPTSRASCAPTPSTSASTASSTSTSTTRASSRARTPTPRPRRSSVRPERRNRRLETRDRAASSSAVVAIVTLVVIGAWQSSGSGAEDAAAAEADARRAEAHAAAAGAVPRRSRRSTGPSYVAVHRDGPAGRLLFQGTIEQGPDRAVQRASTSGSASARPRTCAIIVGGKAVPLSGGKPVAADGDAERGADRLSALARGDRRHGLGARPRRPQRPERPVPRALAARARDRAGRAADRRRRRRPSSRRRSATGSRATCSSSPAASGRPTTTGRSSCSRAPPGGRCALDEELEARIEARSRAVAERLKRPYADFVAGVRKQATVPEGAIVAGLVGTAPALVLELDGCVAVTLPGPPRELQPLWAEALETEPLRRAARAGAAAGAARAALLRRLRVGGRAGARGRRRRRRRGRGDDLRARLRDPRRPLRRRPGAEARADELEAAFLAAARAVPLRARPRSRSRSSCSTLCRERGLTLATAESCTGGLVAGAADVGARVERRLPRRDRRVRERRQGGRARRARGGARARTARCRRETALGDGARARGSGSGPTSRSR